MKIRVCVLFLLLGAVAASQVNTSRMNSNQMNPNQMNRRLRVRVEFSNGDCDPYTHVSLLGRQGMVAEGTIDSQCEVEFWDLPEGTYQVIVSGHDFSQIDGGSVDMSSSFAEFSVRVNHGANSSSDPNAKKPVVSAADLALPSKARKELAKANQLIQKQDFAAALERLNKIVAQYPNYATAYNNMAVIYAHQGNYAKERDALEHAISADDHCAPLYVNLGRLDIVTHDFRGAETALNKASSLDPGDPMTLTILAYAQLLNNKFDDAIATAVKVHSLPGEHALVHHVAARAYEQKGDTNNSIAQLELFLKEEPTGLRADMARNELGVILSAQHSASAAHPPQ